MSFITPLITTIQNVSSEWYYSVCDDERYKGLMETLDIPEPKPTALRYMCYNMVWCAARTNNNTLRDTLRVTLRECISKGDGTPVQLEDLRCSDNMERYRQSVPAFTYNAAVFPPYGDTIHHWHITTCFPYKHVSLITDSKEEICNYINNACGILLFFVPLPDTLQ